MPWNGSGQFIRDNGLVQGATVWQQDRDAGRNIRADLADTHDEDIATGLENAVTLDGQTTPVADLPMGGNKHTNVSNSTARNQYPSTGQVQDGGVVYDGLATGTADAIITTASPPVTALVEGMRWGFEAASTNTTAVTIQRNSVTPVAGEINGAALTGGEIIAGKFYECFFDGTAVQITQIAGPIAIGSLVEDPSPQLGGVLDSNGFQIRESRGSNVTAATTTTIPDDGNQFTVIGNTEITGLTGGGVPGTEITLIFNGTPNLASGPTLNLPGGADIQTVNDDRAVFQKVGAPDTWYCISYIRKDGTAVVGGNKATQSAIEAETVEDTFVSPDTARYIPGAAKALITFNGTLATGAVDLTGVLDSYNIASLVKVSTGVYTINFTDAFANANYQIIGTAKAIGSGNLAEVSIDDSVNPTTGGADIQVNRADGLAIDSEIICVSFFGTQA